MRGVFMLYTAVLCTAVYSFSPEKRGGLVFRERIAIPLQKTVANNPRTVYYEQKGENGFLYALNPIENEIVVFDLAARSCETVKLEPEPTFEIAGFAVSGPDILLYHSASGKGVRYHSGKREGPVMQIGSTEEAVPTPFPSTFCPLKIQGNTIIASTFIAGESPEDVVHPSGTILLYNMLDRSVRYVVPYPSMYKYFWGGGTPYRQVYYDVNGKGEIIISFSASAYLTVYNPETGQNRDVPAKSEYVKKIKPFGLGKAITASNRAVMNWYRKNPSYEGVLYDRWRGLYYRFVLLPEAKNFERMKNYSKKPVSILVMDEEFNILSETRLPEDTYFNPFCSFVAPGGLYIQVRTSNEDEFLFHRFEYVARH